MESWNPLTGDIPPDPPGAPWQSMLGDPPSKIIGGMRKVWRLIDGGTPEHAQALFDRAGAWIDYWLAAREAGGANTRAGVRSAPGPDSEIAPTVILVIYAARQAVLTGRYDLLAFAREHGEQAASAGRAIEQKQHRIKGGEARAGDYGAIRRVVGEIAKAVGADLDAVLREMRRDTTDESDILDDIRESRSNPIDVAFQEVPVRKPGETIKDIRKRGIYFVADGVEGCVTVGTLNNKLSEIRKESRNAGDVVTGV
jgi:hypothetical protein